MTEITKSQNVERLIQGIQSIKNRCSLSDEEVKLLTDCEELLKDLRKETSMHVRKVNFSRVIEILLRFFHNDINRFMDGL
jgi:hypothetical protein